MSIKNRYRCRNRNRRVNGSRNVIWIFMIYLDIYGWNLLFVVYMFTCVQTQGDVTLCLCLGLTNLKRSRFCLFVCRSAYVWTQRSDLKVLSYDIRYCFEDVLLSSPLRKLHLSWIWLDIELVELLTTCLENEWIYLSSSSWTYALCI